MIEYPGLARICLYCLVNNRVLTEMTNGNHDFQPSTHYMTRDTSFHEDPISVSQNLVHDS